MTSTTIRTSLHWQAVHLYADLFRYRDLFLNLFRRELRVKYRGSALGLVWTLINPIVLMLGYWLLFSILLRAVSIEHYPLFVLSGLVTWMFFQQAVQMSCTSLLGHASLVKQVRFPRQLLPLSVVATNLVTMLVMLGRRAPAQPDRHPGDAFDLLGRAAALHPAGGARDRVLDPARLGDRHVPGHRAPRRDGAPPLVHPDADLLHLRPAAGHQLASDDRQLPVLRQPRGALRGGDSRPAVLGQAARSSAT